MMIDICSMIESDVLEVKQLEVECELSPWSIEDYSNEIERADSLTSVAKANSRIIGFAVSRLIIPDNITLFETEIEIFNICVSKSYRRMGIGRHLVDNLIKSSGYSITSIWLEVRKSNTKAQMFYEQMDFKTMGTRKNLYQSPSEDGLVMKIEL